MPRLAFLLLALAAPFALRGTDTDSAKRIPWTTSRIVGSPDPPMPYQTERIFPKLKFDRPVIILREPMLNRLFVVELSGKIFTFPEDPNAEKPDLFIDLSKIPGHWRTYGLAFHPNFAKNRLFYVCYVLRPGNPKGSRVSRFKLTETGPPRAELKDETILLDWPSGGHNGGNLQFGPDGFLYISTGDGSDPNPPDSHNTGQDITDLQSSILRIDIDKTEGDKKYAIPPDNPFVKVEKARPEVWAYGLRNPWKMSFDSKTGDLWCGDVGWEMWEMVYRIEKGGNYGWSITEGRQPVKPEGKRGPSPIIPPIVDHDHTEARSLTGGRVYHGQRLKELEGAYIYGDFVTGKLWGLRYDGKKVTWQQELARSPLQVIDFGEGRDSELYVLDYLGTINRLIPNKAAKANQNFPRKLSETGLYAAVKNCAPAPGVVSYAINAEPWADHAFAERLLAVPGAGKLDTYEKTNFDLGRVKGEFNFPSDTVFAKTLTLEMERGNPKSRRRIETQVLHNDGGPGGTWRAYNYVWNDEQTDAVLADADGFDRTFTIKDAKGGSLKQTWHHASRTECLVCHTTRVGTVIGFTPPQVTDQSLRTLDRLGYFAKPLPTKIAALPNPFDQKQSLDLRARAYLHANCAHCHRKGGGGTAPFQLLFDMKLDATGLIGSRPTQGTFEIHSAENVAAGDPYRSSLYYRMAKLGPARMPYAGSNVIDERGLDLVHEWIAKLPGEAGRQPSVTDEQRAALERLRSSKEGADRAQAIDRLLSSTSGALYLLRSVDTDSLTAGTKKEIIDAAKKYPSTSVKDLFERFLPENERIKRLGNTIKPTAILAVPGDAAHGREVYFKGNGVQCRNCHQIGKEGQNVGPDLSQIGKKLDRAQILESILEPSKKIEPQFLTHILETTSGTVFTGLLIEKNEKKVVLKDAQGKVTTVAVEEVERLVTSQKSLMPELLLRDMTAQDAADLLAFLASLKGSDP